MTRIRMSVVGVLAGIALAVGMPVAVDATASASPMTIKCKPLSVADNPKPGVYTHFCTVIQQNGMMVETFYG
ncbi:hypothetical protein [Gordonia tangerina]|uniref:Secreted protein n=1 Tax=Gordonia tangerina TaxID=2911060 RepID=A0ABS9DNA5_9ACTN|nr:hypothetical protein [Gordonia tangerina]MCF3940688.1 hypothetical protein [Gordonia tangerina]